MKKRLNWKFIIMVLALTLISIITVLSYGAVSTDNLPSILDACPGCGSEATWKIALYANCGTNGTAYITCGTCNWEDHIYKIPATGNHTWPTEATTVITEPTCTVSGLGTFTCTVCSQTEDQVIAALGHNYVTTTIEEATCISTGIKRDVCQNEGCDAYKNETTIAKDPDNHAENRVFKYEDYNSTCHRKYAYYPCCKTYKTNSSGEIAYNEVEHDWDNGTETVAATCTTNGTIVYKCTAGSGEYACGREKTETIDALGHDFSKEDTSEEYLKSAATCQSAAIYYKSCSRCGQKGTTTFEYGEKDPTNHTGTEGEPWVQATMSNTHHYIRTTWSCCAGIGRMDLVEHDFSEEVATSKYLKSAATCTSPEIYYYSCICGMSSQLADGGTFEVGDPIPHTYDQEVTTSEYLKTAATCTSPAIYYYSCTCGAKGTTMFESGSVSGHIYDKEVATSTYLKTAATCTSPAVYYKSCTCGAKGTETFTSGSALAHTYTSKTTTSTYLKTAATCTSPAVYYYKCTGCDAKGTETYTNGSALAHTYTSKTTTSTYLKTAATCTSPAVYYYKCIGCDAKGTETFTSGSALAHEYEIYSRDEAVCEQGGKIVYKCKNCTDTYEETIPAKGHTEVVVPGKSATCTETGLTEGKVCSVCDTVLVAQEEIPVIAHTEETVPGKAATCTQTGLTEGKVCSVCDTVLVAQEEIPIIAHTEETVPGKAATCTQTGLTEGKVCSVCDTVLVAQEEIPATGHNFGEWVVEKEATYEAEGLKYRVCTNCNEERQEEVIPKLTKEEITITTTHTVKEIENNKYIEISETYQLQNFLKNITSNSEVIVKDKDGNVLNSNSKIATGAKVITKEDGKEQFTVILKGDINSDGEVDFKDIIRANAVRIINGENTISKAQLFAADLNNTNKIEFRDIITLNAIRINAGK